MEQEKLNWFKLSELKNETAKMVFMPFELEGKERFQIWDNNGKKFIKEDEKIQTSAGELEVNKFIALKKLTTDEQARFRRSLQFLRKAYVFRYNDGTEEILTDNSMMLGIPKTAEIGLLGVMETVKTMKKNPLHFSYMISRVIQDGFMKYFIHLGEEQPIDMLEKIYDLNDKEKALIKSMKEKEDVINESSENKIKIMVSNDIHEYRAQILVSIFF